MARDGEKESSDPGFFLVSLSLSLLSLSSVCLLLRAKMSLCAAFILWLPCKGDGCSCFSACAASRPLRAVTPTAPFSLSRFSLASLSFTVKERRTAEKTWRADHRSPAAMLVRARGARERARERERGLREREGRGRRGDAWRDRERGWRESGGLRERERGAERREKDEKERERKRRR